MKKIIYLLLICVCFSLHAENIKTATFDISGVGGKVRDNVEKRLGELQQLKTLRDISTEELQVQIIQSLQPFGYFKATVAVRIINEKKTIITINAGQQAHVSSVTLRIDGEGRKNPRLHTIFKEFPLHVGDPLSTLEYNRFKQKLADTAENLGYLHTSFPKAEVLIDETKTSAQITLIFDTGPLYYFGQVEFDPTYIKPELLHRFVPFHPGQPYSTDQILKFNNYLADSGYFSSAIVKPKIGESTTVPVVVHLQRAPKYSYTLGAGYGTDTGIRGRAGLHITPVNRSGHKFNLLGQGSMTQNAVQAQYVVPGKNPITDQYSLTGNFSNLNYDTGYSNAYLLSLGQQHNLDTFKRSLSINGLYESFNYTLQPKENEFLLYPKATFSFIKTKNQLFSPTGYNLTFNALGSSHIALSTIDFFQASMDAKAAYTIEPWRLRLYGHTIQGLTLTPDINKLPLSLALLLGGTDNLKGISFNSIGPGRIISYGGFELQKETKKNWYIVGFFDAGDIYDPKLKAFQYDIGGGLMWVSPIGPIKVGLAQPINNQLQRTSNSPRLVINMGPDL